MKFSIRLKLIAFTFCVVLLVGASISLYSIYQGRQRIFTTFEKDARDITAIISGTIVNDLYFLDLRSLRWRLQSARVNPEISYTLVTDSEGVVLTDGTEENALRDQKLADPFSQEVLRSKGWISRVEGEMLKVGGPIFAPDGSRIGHLYVGFSLGQAYETVRETTRTSLYITFICLGIGALLAVVLSISFSRPILSMVQASREIGEGKLDTRLPIQRGDELGALAQSINQMVESLQMRQVEAKRAREALEKSNKVKDEFLGFVSHELRTPVNAVIGYAGMVRDKMLGEINLEQEKTLGKVIGRSKDLLDMINGLLEATRIEAGAVKVESHEVSLGHFLDELRSGYDAPLGKELSLNWDYPSQLPAIRTDSAKLKHILQNLINNAIKYTDQGHVSISARCLAGARAAEFEVTDTGIGISKEALPAIFEMFRQGKGSKNGRRGGVGLGLHIVKKFTEMLGGRIEVKSEPGRGSTFTVTIPEI